MKKISLFIMLVVITVTGFGQIDNAIPPAPHPPRLVNDFTARTLSAADRDKLEKRLVDFDRDQDVQVAIVILDSTSGFPSDDFAKAIGNKWGIGNQVKNNGIVILITTGGGVGKRDLVIQLGKAYTGYPVEEVLRGIIAEMVPLFKEGKMYEGLDKGIDRIMEAIDKLNELTGSAGNYDPPYAIAQKIAG